MPNAQIGAAALATNQVTVGNTATQIVAARSETSPGVGRAAVKITNLGTVDVFIGGPSVAVGSGDLLPGIKGAWLYIETTAAIFGICGSSQAVSFIEIF